jgi:hypothetical protein
MLHCCGTCVCLFLYSVVDVGSYGPVDAGNGDVEAVYVVVMMRWCLPLYSEGPNVGSTFPSRTNTIHTSQDIYTYSERQYLPRTPRNTINNHRSTDLHCSTHLYQGQHIRTLIYILYTTDPNDELNNLSFLQKPTRIIRFKIYAINTLPTLGLSEYNGRNHLIITTTYAYTASLHLHY